MNTYRVFVLDASNVEAPKALVAFVRGEKYADAWKNARGALARKEGKSFVLHADAEGKGPAKIFVQGATVARIDDIRPRNVKLDKAKLQEILASKSSTPEEKLAAMQAMIG